MLTPGVVPRRTVRRYVNKFKEFVDSGISFDKITADMIFRDRRSLLSDGDIKFLVEINKARDETNNGMARSKAITLIMEISGPDSATSKNHWNHLVRNKKLLELKKGGRLSKAQGTTKNRTEITVEQQLR